ncbi:UNVERIFIED_CONTAM: hypothetical protein FKN15_008399 [Acipenser sinensis]
MLHLSTESLSLFQSDFGGPLSCEVDGNWVQAGITSFVNPNNILPGVFTRVTFYSSWIQKHVTGGLETVLPSFLTVVLSALTTLLAFQFQ